MNNYNVHVGLQHETLLCSNFMAVLIKVTITSPVIISSFRILKWSEGLLIAHL